MIKLPNGPVVRYVAASGALAFDGLGWPWERPLVSLGVIDPDLLDITFIKSLTLKPTVGNLRLRWPFNCIRLLPGGAVNRVGLTNPGYKAWREQYGDRIDWKRAKLGSSVFGSEKEIVEMLLGLDQYPFLAHEINLSCPNTGHPTEDTAPAIKAVKAAYQAVERPLIAKVSVDMDYVTIAKALLGTVVALSLNTVKWETLYPGKPSPLDPLERKLGTPGKGGVSGVPAQEANWAAVRRLKEEVPEMPVIGPSVMSYGDVAKVRAAGADAISFGTCFMRTPWRPKRIILRDMRGTGLLA